MIKAVPSDSQGATVTRGTAHLSVAEKWAGAVTESSGFVAVPMVLLRAQAKLGLTATDFTVLVNLLAHWWDPTKSVYPRSTTIAARMGVDKRTVQRSVQKLLDLGLVRRELVTVNGQELRGYQFGSLVKRLAREAPETFNIAATETIDAPKGRPRKVDQKVQVD